MRSTKSAAVVKATMPSSVLRSATSPRCSTSACSPRSPSSNATVRPWATRPRVTSRAPGRRDRCVGATLLVAENGRDPIGSARAHRPQARLAGTTRSGRSPCGPVRAMPVANASSRSSRRAPRSTVHGGLGHRQAAPARRCGTPRPPGVQPRWRARPPAVEDREPGDVSPRRSPASAGDRVGRLPRPAGASTVSIQGDAAGRRPLDPAVQPHPRSAHRTDVSPNLGQGRHRARRTDDGAVIPAGEGRRTSCTQALRGGRARRAVGAVRRSVRDTTGPGPAPGHRHHPDSWALD